MRSSGVLFKNDFARFKKRFTTVAVQKFEFRFG